MTTTATNCLAKLGESNLSVLAKYIWVFPVYLAVSPSPFDNYISEKILGIAFESLSLSALSNSMLFFVLPSPTQETSFLRKSANVKIL